MDTQQLTRQTAINVDEFLRNGIAETFAGNLYTIIDYSNEEGFLYVEYDKYHDKWSIEETNLDMTEAQKSKAFDMVWELIKSNQD